VTSALDRIPGGVLSLSHDLRIVTASRPMARLVEREPHELVGELFDVFLTPPSRILFQTHVYPALEADGGVEEVFLTLSANGEPVPVLFNAAASGGSARAAYDALVVRIRSRARWEGELLSTTRALEQERTASQRLAADLEARYADERRSRAFRDAFIGVISHELRTPITTIYGMSNLVRRQYAANPDTAAPYLDDIASEAARLQRLTEDLLVLSRAEGGRLELSSEPIRINHVVDRVVRSERERSGSHEIVPSIADGLPLVWGDEVSAEQVLRNFLSNAVKYSPAGSQIRVIVGEEDAGVAVLVVDQGSGLPDGPTEQLFEVFYRAPGAVGQAPGAGIGLFVCRELVQAMRGRIWAKPSEGSAGGAEFGFWLPPMSAEDEQ
jgi:signal transduction histidine kinase